MNYLFVGASSAMAIEAAQLLINHNHTVTGISTHTPSFEYTKCYQVNSYQPEELPDLFDPIDGLVYFPGNINLKPFNRISPQDFMTDYTLNVIGAVNSIQKYLPLLKQSKQASVVLFSSIAATTGMAFHASIGSAKAALEGLCKSLAAEFAPHIRFNCIAPSLTDTPMAQRLINTTEKLEASAKRHPMQRVGHVKDLAQAIHFLITEQSSWITGQVLHVDGGMHQLKV